MESRLTNEIPKTLHYCWFGGSELGEQEKRCIESWRKYLPQYEIVKWDESNFDLGHCSYVQEAYAAGKWAFVSDYARFAILYEHGGLYFDTDVELIRPIDDIIQQGPYMGFETDYFQDARHPGEPTVNAGLGLAAPPGLALYRAVLDSYERGHFVQDDGSPDLTTVVRRVTEILRGYGLANIEGIQHVAGVNIYPAEYFNPKDFLTGKIRLTDNTRSIHHFSMSWLSDGQRYTRSLASRFTDAGLPTLPSRLLARLISTVRFRDWNGLKVSIIKHIARK